MIESKFYSRLKTVAANVYPLAAPRSYTAERTETPRAPAVVYQRVNTDPQSDFDELDEQAWIEMQVDVYSTSHVDAETLARTIRTSLKAWQDADVQTVAYTNHHSSVDNTTDVALYRVMTFYRLFVNAD